MISPTRIASRARRSFSRQTAPGGRSRRLDWRRADDRCRRYAAVEYRLPERVLLPLSRRRGRDADCDPCRVCRLCPAVADPARACRRAAGALSPTRLLARAGQLGDHRRHAAPLWADREHPAAVLGHVADRGTAGSATIPCATTGATFPTRHPTARLAGQEVGLLPEAPAPCRPQPVDIVHRITRHSAPRAGGASALLAPPCLLTFADVDRGDHKGDGRIKPPKTQQLLAARPTNTATARMAHKTFCVPSP